MPPLLDALLEPFRYPFMVEAMLAGTAIAAVCAVLSCYLVLKGWSLMGDAISHAVLPGMVLAYFFGLPIALGAFLSGLFCAVSAGFIRANSRVKEDTVLGVVFTGLFALGLVLFTKLKVDLHIDKVLFGNILGLLPGDLRATLLTSAVVLAVIVALRRDLLLFCFDPAQARAIGLRTGWLYYLLLSLLAVTIVVSLKAVGIILVVAMLVTPGCVGFLLTQRFGRMLWIAVATAVGSSFVGVYSSFFLNASTAACIVLTQALVFVGAMAFAPKHGLLRRRRGAASAST
ncbi:hypothetical protein AXK11_05945 [Cephaloticoccus primus]|uniref:Iron ABC transporter permease n=1 Tax=Cephaloticoccus primus TaxID=1548207 RepID=A0A139SLV0_9BACT|nr:metal ABC transporter permease [Cephaloticoccus primus]KXU35533.1 hypothetical protein AXK11_05945 [Cephaloticoccus primus]